MSDRTGAPSAIRLGTELCKGEQWVSPGVGQQFIDYLRRTYGGKPAARAHKAPLVTYDKLLPVRAEPERLTACVDCGNLFHALSAKHTRCAACRRLHERDALRVRREQLAAKRSPAVMTQRIVCAWCGSKFEHISLGGHGNGRRYCSAHCKEQQRRQTRREQQGCRETVTVRRLICAHCGNAYMQVLHGAHGANRRYCSARCRKAAGRLRERSSAHGSD